MSEQVDVLRGIAAEIVYIMAVYDEQCAQYGYPGTPGGLEHMGDVWGLLDRWRNEIKRVKADK